MHIDTHGGIVNTLTHQREVVVIAAPGHDGMLAWTNVADHHADAELALADLRAAVTADCSWAALQQTSAVRRLFDTHRHRWTRYATGVCLRWLAEPRHTLPALRLTVASDLPAGAALSSSGALCLALLAALYAATGTPWAPEDAVRFARDAEWFAGARTGLADQLAIAGGDTNTCLHLPIDPERGGYAGARHVPVPASLRFLVADSRTRRDLSGAQRIAYAANRFAYTFALQLLDQALYEHGIRLAHARPRLLLADCDPRVAGGSAPLLAAVHALPARATLDDLRHRVGAAAVDAEFDRYFGDVPAAEQPRDFALRGPLLFALAETERARQFPEALEKMDLARIGALMRTGHNGDRLVDEQGQPYRAPETAADLADVPGAYGASTHVLDAIVDAAHEAGALGACLTGAGLGGAVIVACRAEDTDTVSAALAQHVNRKAAAAEIVVNHAVAAAGHFER